MSEWQLIETAPRDGRAIIVFVPEGVHLDHRGKPVQRANFVTQTFWITRPPTDSIRKATLERTHGGYWSNGKRLALPLTGGPTHWQPMPVAP